MKERTIRIAAAAIRGYIQYFPVNMGKVWLWHKIIRNYIIWRPIKLQARTRDGLLFLGSFPDLLHSYIYFFGVWEPNVTAYLRSALKRGDIFIDIGANVGAHTLLASRLVGGTGRVHAIEASPSIFHRLQVNLAANAAVNVHAYHMAVSDKAGPVTVFLHDASNLGGTTVVASEAAVLNTTLEQVVEGHRLQASFRVQRFAQRGSSRLTLKVGNGWWCAECGRCCPRYAEMRRSWWRWTPEH